MHHNNLPVIVKRLSSHNGNQNHRGENCGRPPRQTQMRSRAVVTPTTKWQYL